MKHILLSLFICVLSYAQVLPPAGKVRQLYYTGGGALQYVCEASAQVGPTSVKFADTTLTNIVVSGGTATVTTASAHNLWTGARVIVANSGVTSLDGTYTATFVSSTTYTFPTAAANGTYTTGIVITTNSPLLNSNSWSITVLHYNGSSQLDGVYPAGPGASQSYSLACTARATY